MVGFEKMSDQELNENIIKIWKQMCFYLNKETQIICFSVGGKTATDSNRCNYALGITVN